MHTPADIKYMRRALDLAALGLGTVAPNPMVGAVVVYQDTIIGEGYHMFYGKAHAEVNAIANVSDAALLKKSTLYVTLEPCSHTGKTPPCANLILAHGIPKVVIACVDASEKVNGSGIDRLISAGVEVVVGVLEQEARTLNRRFFTQQALKRPYVIAKWAESSDGYIGGVKNGVPIPVKITGEVSQVTSHQWRTQEQAIMVGTTTALIDNPSLTPRHWKGQKPLRVVLDAKGLLPSTHILLADEFPTLLIQQSGCKTDHTLSSLKQIISIDFNKNVITQVLEVLYKKGIQSILVEGGASLLKSFQTEEVVDEYRIFTSQAIVLSKGIKAPNWPGNASFSIQKQGEDYLHTAIVIPTFV